MKAFLRWMSRILGSAITIILTIVLFPYISDLAARLLPNEAGAAIKTSAIIASRFRESARLETFNVEEDGVINYEIQAAFIGTVANVNIKYRYNASFGIDLQKVQLQTMGDEIVFKLPLPEMMQDAITLTESYRDDFWFPGFTDDDFNQLLENERLLRRRAHMTGENSEQMQAVTLSIFESTIKTWMSGINSQVRFRYEWLAQPTADE